MAAVFNVLKNHGSSQSFPAIMSYTHKETVSLKLWLVNELMGGYIWWGEINADNMIADIEKRT